MAQTLALIQPWIDFIPPKQRRLGLFIVLALMVHLLAFLFISIDTTRAELTHSLRPHVTVEDPTPTAAVAGVLAGDNFWDRMNDPRLFLFPSGTSAGIVADMPSLDAMAADASIGVPGLPSPVAPGDFQFARPVNEPLDQQVAESMNPARQPFVYDSRPPVISPETTWQLDGALTARQPAGLPELPSPISDTDLGPTQMRIAVGPGGTVEHVLVEQSCGKAEFDQQAVLAARKIRFHSVDQQGLVWGRLSVFWRYSAHPREEVVPTPPSPN